jgi:uncharacterized membrane protein (UPF0182 family)
MTETGLRSLRGGKLLVVCIALVGGLLILGRLVSDLYVEVLWYRSSGYTPVFLKRLSWLWGTRLGWGAIVVVSLVTSLRLVARTLGGIQIKRRFGNLEISEQLPRTYVWWGIVGVSALLGAWFGSAVNENVAWALLVALQGADWGLTDPVLGRDVSFYVFDLPLLGWGVGYTMVLVFLVFTMSTAGYAATGAVRWGRRGVVMANQARVHLGALVALFLVLIAVRLWISRSSLLLTGNSGVTGLAQGIFGYADAEARLPAYRAMSVITLASAAAVMWGVWRNRLVPVVAGVASVAIGSLLVVQFYPSLVQRFRVEPNELQRETPYIEHNLDFTRHGFALTGLERQRFQYRPTDSIDWAEARTQFDGLPVWPREALLGSFRMLDSRRPYYTFSTVGFTRYPSISNAPHPVAISVREIDVGGIQDGSWQNVHLRDPYIAGLGAVVAAAADRTPEGRPRMYLSSIPDSGRVATPELTGGPEGLRLDQQTIFFGALNQAYAVLNGASGCAADEPQGQVASPVRESGGQPGVDFPEGILLENPLRKLVLSWRFRDTNLLISSQVTDSCRLVFRRGVKERASAIAPFFRYPEDPYPVIADGRVFWILEGVTSTRSFPLSRSVEVEAPRQFASYARNSIKVTVDAVTGDTRFYALSESDPLRDAYGRAFPGLLRSLEEMPASLRAHLRYSSAFFQIQSRVLHQYHEQEAPRFHGQQDVWETPHERFMETTEDPYEPEYGVYKLPGEQWPSFSLTTAFTPAGRLNLAAILVGRVDDTGTPQLILYEIPVEDQAQGPSQVEALVEQNPEIAQQFTLWRSGGSNVWTGHLHIVPVGSQLLYMEAIFLAATAQAIPELQRFVVSDGRRVSMGPTLDAAVAALAGDRAPRPRDPQLELGTLTPYPGAGLWPREALDLLDMAEERLRQGDYTGFGTAIAELRRLLERLAPQGG